MKATCLASTRIAGKCRACGEPMDPAHVQTPADDSPISITCAECCKVCPQKPEDSEDLFNGW